MKNLYRFLAISILIHLLLLLWMKMPEKVISIAKPMEMVWVDLNKNKQCEIVDILPPMKENRPKDSKFLGMYDSLTKKETVAETPPTPSDAKKISESPEGGATRVGRTPMKKERGPGNNINRKPIEEFGLNEDFYPDFNRGKHTYLNVLRFPDIEYFVRLKRIFKTTWNPQTPLREAYYNNQISRGRIETVLGVSLDPQGNLAEVFIFRGSGNAGYDEEALRTIRASAPFAVPPSKLLEKEGLLRMSWTFSVYL